METEVTVERLVSEKSKYSKLTAKINKIKETINAVAGCKLYLYDWLWDCGY